MRNYGEVYSIGGLEELRLAFDGQLAQFLLRENRLLDLLFGRSFGVGFAAWGEISMAGLQPPFLFARERHFQVVVFAIELEVLRRKSEYIRNFRLGRGMQQTLINVIPVVKVNPAGAVCQIRKRREVRL